ncbi:Uncharacterized protein TCM_005570 [Theobroma cacao]|uniref:Uncharacterized protein n=1 Tax=Theobroma cacao TaxID=3641 RepID=A0A061DU92_THECC|nr:Uncharacterized protein TCM_005570 [Theobroma cacao]
MLLEPQLPFLVPSFPFFLFLWLYFGLGFSSSFFLFSFFSLFFLSLCSTSTLSSFCFLLWMRATYKSGKVPLILRSYLPGRVPVVHFNPTLTSAAREFDYISARFHSLTPLPGASLLGFCLSFILFFSFYRGQRYRGKVRSEKGLLGILMEQIPAGLVFETESDDTR